MNLYQYVNFGLWNQFKSGVKEIGGRFKNVGQGLKDSWNISHTDRSGDINKANSLANLTNEQAFQGLGSYIKNANKANAYMLNGQGNSRAHDYYQNEADAAWKGYIRESDNARAYKENAKTLQGFNRKNFLPNVGKAFGNLFKSSNRPNELNSTPSLQPIRGYWDNNLYNMDGSPYQPPQQ